MNEFQTEILKQAEKAFNENDIQSASKYLAKFGKNLKDEENIPLEYLNLSLKCINKDLEFLDNQS